MPVILENGSDQIRTWLDPKRSEWSRELQSLLKPYAGELDCYPVIKDVGKVGNNSPDFIVPVDSSENKNNIANFFAKAQKPTKEKPKKDGSEHRITVDKPRSEDNAPVPVPVESNVQAGVKRERDEDDEVKPQKAAKLDMEVKPESPEKSSAIFQHVKKTPDKKTRSAVSNGTMEKASPSKNGAGNQKITSFFNK